MIFLTEALGLSGLGAFSGGGAGGVETLGQPAALARRGVLVQRALRRHAVHPLHRQRQRLLSFLDVPAAQCAGEAFDLLLDHLLAMPVAGATLEVLPDALLG